MLITSILLSILWVGEASKPPPPWPHPYWDIGGDYCRSLLPQGQCCQGRQDGCSRNILDTLCYCDTFCNR